MRSIEEAESRIADLEEQDDWHDLDPFDPFGFIMARTKEPMDER